MPKAVLVDVGVPMGLVIASIHERRDAFRDALRRKEGASGQGRAREFHGRRTKRTRERELTHRSALCSCQGLLNVT